MLTKKYIHFNKEKNYLHLIQKSGPLHIFFWNIHTLSELLSKKQDSSESLRFSRHPVSSIGKTWNYLSSLNFPRTAKTYSNPSQHAQVAQVLFPMVKIFCILNQRKPLSLKNQFFKSKNELHSPWDITHTFNEVFYFRTTLKFFKYPLIQLTEKFQFGKIVDLSVFNYDGVTYNLKIQFRICLSFLPISRIFSIRECSNLILLVSLIDDTANSILSILDFSVFVGQFKSNSRYRC